MDWIAHEIHFLEPEKDDGNDVPVVNEAQEPAVPFPIVIHNNEKSDRKCRVHQN